MSGAAEEERLRKRNMFLRQNTGPGLLEKEAQYRGWRGVPFWVPTLRGEERVRDKPGGRSEKGKVRRLPPRIYTDFSFLSHNNTRKFQMDRNGLASFWNQSLQMIILVCKRQTKTLPSKKDTYILNIHTESMGFQELIKWKDGIRSRSISVPWEVMPSEPWLQVHETSGEVVSAIRRAQRLWWIGSSHSVCPYNQ